MDAKLIEIARRSPKAYAVQIKERNTKLLEKLELVRPYVGMPIETIPEDIAKAVMEMLPIGCPHCQTAVALSQKNALACDICLWTAIFGKSGCMHAQFSYAGGPANNFSTILDLDVVSLGYMYDSACINLGVGSQILSQSDFDICYNFLKAHVEWAELDCWGADYVQPPAKEE